ncbi:VOC family protein [Bacillus sp. 1P06AnD]|uniref:VOC family protein n=1 Tax=Bacillus sp. 1P06AnD TaxID=3132208 RepID=UPI0039A2FB5F
MIKGLVPYLVTNGNGQEAIAFYEKALHAEVLNAQTFGDMPGPEGKEAPAEMKNLILNAQLKVGEAQLMLSDEFPGNPYQIGSQVTIAIIVDDASQAQQLFGNLEEGGTVIMPLQETFWSPAYGQVLDQYGVTWKISTELAEQNQKEM